MNWPILKLRTSVYQKIQIKRMKNQAIDLEKIFAIHISDKGLSSKMCKLIRERKPVE